MLARDIMTQKPITVQPQTRVREALEIMMNEDIRHVPVVEGNRLVGMVSDRDLRHLAFPMLLQDTDATPALAQAVGDAMSGGVVNTTADADVDDVIDLLLEHKVGALPVVDEADGDLVGIISYTDVLQAARGRI